MAAPTRKDQTMDPRQSASVTTSARPTSAAFPVTMTQNGRSAEHMPDPAILTRRLARYRAAREMPMNASKRRQLDALICETEALLIAATPITCWEDLETFDWLTEEQKAAIWEAFYEYHGEDVD